MNSYHDLCQCQDPRASNTNLYTRSRSPDNIGMRNIEPRRVDLCPLQACCIRRSPPYIIYLISRCLNQILHLIIVITQPPGISACTRNFIVEDAECAVWRRVKECRSPMFLRIPMLRAYSGRLVSMWISTLKPTASSEEATNFAIFSACSGM
jgi:hypothetical protein